MSNYRRVIPRDFFNEASLLKCYGQLAIRLGETRDHDARFEEDEVSSFEIEQDVSGGLTVANVLFTVRGRVHRLERPLNSRETWPLWLGNDEDPDFDQIAVFNGDGDLSSEFLTYIRGGEHG